MKPLKGGLRLDGKKDATLTPWTAARPSAPRRVRLPLIDTEGNRLRPRVGSGQHVRIGEKVADGGETLHASVSGTVGEIGEAIEISSDGKNEKIPGLGCEQSLESLKPKELVRMFRESGLPILKEQDSSIDTLILNGCESEPYLTSDHSLMMSRPVEILKAGEILSRAFLAKELIIVLEDNKQEIAELLKSKIFFNPWSKARVEVFPALYPQGNDQILIRELGKSRRGKGVMVQNVAMAYAAYEAVALQKPFYERIVTIAGECVAQPRNFWLRIGTSTEEAVKYARGFLREPERVIHGGPMTGIAIDSLNAPVLKTTRGILGLPPEVTELTSVEPCIRCGLCVESCPVSISPAMITLAAEKDFFALAKEYGAEECIACGNCSYVCPAKRPMVELIQYANAN